MSTEAETFPPDGGEIDYPDWPAVLRKAVHDYWVYAVGLENEETVIFRTAEIEGDWITLKEIVYSGLISELNQSPQYQFGRGLCVHKSRILWCADSGD